MAAVLGFAVDAGEREAFKTEFIDNALRHTVHADDDLSSDPGCPPLVAEFYRALKDAVRDGVLVDSPQLRQSIERWNAELERINAALRLADMRLSAPVQPAPEAGALEMLKTVARHAPDLLISVFDRTWYSLAYTDVAEAGLDPFRHYSETGVHEGRHPGPDVVSSAQRALDELVGTRELAGARLLYVEQARRDEGRWADIMELQRDCRDRERSLNEELQGARRGLQQALERHAEREAACVARERDNAQAAEASAQRYLAEIDSVRRDGAAREVALAEQREHAESEIRRLLAHAVEREAACSAAAGAVQREHAERVMALARLADQRHEEHQRQVQAVRDHVETLLRQLAELESRSQQREATLQAEHAAQIVCLQHEQKDNAARVQREREEEVARLLGERADADAGWAAKLAHALAEGDATRVRAEEERAALAQELDRVRSELDAIRGSVAWRVIAPFARRSA
jgi:hypothetical protein